MVQLNKQLKAYGESQPFHRLINLACCINDHVFLAKSGDVICMFSVHGPDAESLGPSELDAAAATLVGAMRAFGDDFIVNSYWIKRSNPSIEEEFCADPLVNAALRGRYEYLTERRKRLFSYDSYLAVTRTREARVARSLGLADLLRWSQRLRTSFSTTKQVAELDRELEHSVSLLQRTVTGFAEQLRDVFRVRLLNRHELFAVLRRLLNPDPMRADAVRLKYNHGVDFQAVDSELTCYRNHLRLGDEFLKILTVKEPPVRSFAHMMSKLTGVSGNLVVVSEWRPLEPSKAISIIRSKRRHFHNTKTGLSAQMSGERPYEREMLFDDSKEALTEDLGRCLEDVEMFGTQIGHWSQTFMLHGATLEDVERTTAEIIRIVGAHEGAVNEETYNCLNAYLAVLPGGAAFNLRRLLVTEKNHIDLGLWCVPHSGSLRNAFLGAPALLTLETEQNSLFHFNIHDGDVGHALVFGMTGSGKSVLLNCLVTHAQKYTPFTIIFDVGGSYRWLTQAFGGSCISVGRGSPPFSINPFALEPTPFNRQFQFDFARLLIESDGHVMGDGEQKDLFESIEALVLLEKDQQRMGTLAAMLPPGQSRHLRRWTGDGQYGAWFDCVEDTVSYAKFQCIDFEDIDSLGKALEPLLFYLLHRVNDIVSDPSRTADFKLCVVDEAWRFCANPLTRNYIATGLRTWRKKNGTMVLATQSAGDLTTAEAMRPILDNCPTRILLANPSLDAGLYREVLRLTETEVERVRSLVPKRQFLLKQGGVSKILSLNLDPRSYWLYTTNPFEAKRRDEAVAALGLEGALDHLAGGIR